MSACVHVTARYVAWDGRWVGKREPALCPRYSTQQPRPRHCCATHSHFQTNFPKIVVTQLTIGFVQALVCMCGWAVCRLHANTSLMHAMHAMQRPVWDQSGLRSISYMALKGACRNRTWRSSRHARIAELQTDWRNSPMISSLRCIISL